MKNAFVERELSRWMHPDASNFVRPDWRRYVYEDSELAAVLVLYEQKYRPDQPRCPPEAGKEGSGQTTAALPLCRRRQTSRQSAHPE